MLMLRFRKQWLLAPIALLVLALPAFSQDEGDRPRPVQTPNPNTPPPLSPKNVEKRPAKAIDYRHKGKKVELDLVGTSLMPDARGRAQVEPHTGRMKID